MWRTTHPAGLGEQDESGASTANLQFLAAASLVRGVRRHTVDGFAIARDRPNDKQLGATERGWRVAPTSGTRYPCDIGDDKQRCTSKIWGKWKPRTYS